MPKVPNEIRLVADNSQLQLQAAEGEGEHQLRKFTGTAYTGAKIDLSGWPDPVVVDLSGVKVSAKPRPILRDHDFSKVIGHTESVNITPRTIAIAGVVSGANGHSTEIIGSSDAGFPWQMSIGAKPDKVVFLEDGETASVNGRKISGPSFIVRQSTLKEVSFVALGADDATSAKVAATAASPLVEVMTMKFEEWLTANGWGDGAAITDSQMTKLKALHAMETNPPAPPAGKSSAEIKSGEDLINATVSPLKAAEQRNQQIASVVSAMIKERPSLIHEIEQAALKAVSTGMDPDKFELELLRDLRPQTGGMGSRRGKDNVNSKIVEAALCSQAKVSHLEKKFDAQTLEMADKHFPQGLGLAEVVLLAARENGCTALSMHNTRHVLEHAFPRHIRAGDFSTISLPGILSNLANKSLDDAYNAVESEWRKITAVTSSRDFKQTSKYSLTGDYTYKQLGQGGQMQHAVPGEETYHNQVKTYARVFGVTREDLINDDLGAFTQIPKKMGRGAALAINLAFWTEFLDNSSFFTTGNGNYDAGLNSEFDADGLINADGIFRAQTDPDGNPLGSMARILLVPPGSRIPAMRLMNSQQVLTASDAGSSNPFSGMFEVVSSVYMANTAIGGDTLAWYLLADPNDIAVMETVFLNGKESPTIESADADFDTLGIQIRAYHDFGVAKHNYRGGLKMKGAT